MRCDEFRFHGPGPVQDLELLRFSNNGGGWSLPGYNFQVTQYVSRSCVTDGTIIVSESPVSLIQGSFCMEVQYNIGLGSRSFYGDQAEFIERAIHLQVTFLLMTR